MLRKGLISSLTPPPHEDLIPSHLHLKSLQRAWRRTRDISAVEVVPAVVAGAPDLTQIVAVLDCAREMRAGCRHGAVLSAGGADEQARTIAKAEDLPTVRLQLADTPGYDRVATDVGGFRWHKITQDGI
jgi:hypothetical protein